MACKAEFVCSPEREAVCRPVSEILPATDPASSADSAGSAVAAEVDWETAYRDNVHWVYRIALGRLGNHEDAEDVTAEVFTRALPRLRMGAQPEQVRAYLAATSRSVLAEHWRRSYGLILSTSFELELPNGDAGIEARSNSLHRVNRLLALLSEHYRRVLELRFLHGYSIAETAKALGLSAGNVKVLQYRALRRAAELGGDEPR